jgi:hypothetical protein
MVTEDQEENKVVDERYMGAKERKILDSSLNKKRKTEDVLVTSARETGWDFAYEDEKSVEGGLMIMIWTEQIK